GFVEQSPGCLRLTHTNKEKERETHRSARSLWQRPPWPSSTIANRRPGLPGAKSGGVVEGRTSPGESSDPFFIGSAHKVMHPPVLLWRSEPPRYLGHEAQRAPRSTRRVPNCADGCPWAADL